MEGMRQVVLPSVEVEVPEWDGTVTLRALTRAQVRACRDHATVEGKVDLDTYDLAVLAYGVADPDLVESEGLEEAIRLLRLQPVSLIWRLVRETVRLSGLTPDAPFRSRTADDAGQRGVHGTSTAEGSGGDDLGRDEKPDDS